MKKGWCMCYWGGRPTEDWMFSTAYSDSAAWNDTFWKHDRFNQLLIGARAELNDELRREMYVEMQSIVRDDGGVVVPLFNNYVFATSDKIRARQDAGQLGSRRAEARRAVVVRLIHRASRPPRADNHMASLKTRLAPGLLSFIPTFSGPLRRLRQMTCPLATTS